MLLAYLLLLAVLRLALRMIPPGLTGVSGGPFAIRATLTQHKATTHYRKTEKRLKHMSVIKTMLLSVCT